MVAFGVVGAEDALRSVDFATIVLLFSMMLVVANLRVGGFFEHIAEWIIARLHPHHLLPTVPWFRLRALRKLLVERGVVPPARELPSYLDVLALASSRA